MKLFIRDFFIRLLILMLSISFLCLVGIGLFFKEISINKTLIILSTLFIPFYFYYKIKFKYLVFDRLTPPKLSVYSNFYKNDYCPIAFRLILYSLRNERYLITRDIEEWSSVDYGSENIQNFRFYQNTMTVLIPTEVQAYESN